MRRASPTAAWNTRELGLFFRLTHYERRRRVYVQAPAQEYR